MAPSPHRASPSSFVVGVDLGQSADYTAIVVCEYFKPQDDTLRHYQVRHVERVPLGTSYPVIVARVQTILQAEALQKRSALVVDATGVGQAVVDMLRQAGLRPLAVYIHGGDRVHPQGGMRYNVPKRDLVGVLQVLLHSRRLEFAAAHPMTPVLVQELTNFKVTIDPHTAHDSYSAWRDGIHDDLVLACALACWWGEYQDKRRIRTL